MEAIGHPARRRIIDELAQGERTAGELAALFAISRPGVSRHLKVLCQARLVSSRREAQRQVYRLTPAPLAEVDAWLGRYRDWWAGALDALEAEVRRMNEQGGGDDR